MTVIVFLSEGTNLALDQPVINHALPSLTYVQPPNQSFESVEMERLKMLKEVSRVGSEEADFSTELAKLHKKLLDASAGSKIPGYMTSDYNSFVNASSKDVKHTEQYYKKIQDVLNQLTPESPYNSKTHYDTVNPVLASQLLKELGEYQEDDGISRSIINQWSAKEGGQKDDAYRIMTINKNIKILQDHQKQLEWNFNIGTKINPLTRQQITTHSELASIAEEIAETKSQITTLVGEKSAIGGTVTIPLRRLEFQQFIVSLASQQRNIHALIACGIYRNAFQGGDMSISDKAYASANNFPKEAPTLASKESSKMPGNAPASTLPIFNTIISMESFLLNRIRDAKMDRESLDNMLRTKHLSAAEALLRKMIVTAKYQPELQTFPYDDRQRIQNYSQTLRQLGEALDSKDFPEIDNLADHLEKQSTDVGVADLKAFAKENREKSLLWIKMADIAARSGDISSAESLLDAARRRAPTEKSVEDSIARVQSKIGSGEESMRQLNEVIKNGDYAQAYNKMSDFIPLIAANGDPTQKKQFNDLIGKEKEVLAAIEKSELLKKMSDAPDAWMALEVLGNPMKNDSLVLEKKSRIAADCTSFISSYEKAKQFDSDGKKNLALSYYLQAQSNAPSSDVIREKIKLIAAQVLSGY